MYSCVYAYDLKLKNKKSTKLPTHMYQLFAELNLVDYKEEHSLEPTEESVTTITPTIVPYITPTIYPTCKNTNWPTTIIPITDSPNKLTLQPSLPANIPIQNCNCTFTCKIEKNTENRDLLIIILVTSTIGTILIFILISYKYYNFKYKNRKEKLRSNYSEIEFGIRGE